jgi:hypothetical protein
VERLNRELLRIVEQPVLREKYAALGPEAVKSSPDDLAAARRKDLAQVEQDHQGQGHQSRMSRGTTMVIDERTYSIAPGLLADYLAHHFALALPVVRRHLGEPHACHTTETGELNQFVHLWRYDSMADRALRRAALYADPAWLAYRQAMGERRWVVHQYNRLLKSVDIPPPAS